MLPTIRRQGIATWLPIKGEEDKVTEAEATDFIEEQLSGGTGFLSRLRLGHGIDEGELRDLYRALDALRDAWRECDCVPTKVLVVLMRVDEAVVSCIDMYPNLADKLVHIEAELIERIERALALPAPTDALELRGGSGTSTREAASMEGIPSQPMSPTDAEAIVRYHFFASNPNGLITKLRMGEGLDRAGVGVLLRGLRTLADAHYWAHLGCVPKELAINFVVARSAILSSWELYPDMQEELDAFARDVSDALVASLS